MHASIRRIAVAVGAAAIVMIVGGTVVAQTGQRFSDVPPDHEHWAAVGWAAEAGVTTGYEDGTFRPDQPLSKRHAVVFMERYYDEILGADQSEGFTRGDMMMLLYTINSGSVVRTAAVGPTAYMTDDWPPAFLEPGLYRFVAYLTGTGPIHMQDLGTNAQYTFDRDNDFHYLELGCEQTAEQVEFPTLYQMFVRFGRFDAGTLAYQRLMDCPPEFELPR